MKPSGRLGQSGQKHNAVRTKLLCRASEGYFPAYTLFRRISKKIQIIDLRIKISGRLLNISRSRNFVLADYRAREGL